MKCLNCSAELRLNGDMFYCDFCDATFPKEELMPSSAPSKPEFMIKGGVLLSYQGNKEFVELPDGVVSIGPSAFKNNLVVKKIVFATSVLKIENNAFEGCSNLIEISNYDNVSHFGDEAFMYSGLKEIKIENAVAFIGKRCFSKMPNLEYVIYMPEKDLKHNHTFYHCPKLQTVEMDRWYFFPSFRTKLDVRNNPYNERSTYVDAFAGTPYLDEMKEYICFLYKQSTCPDCGGRIKKRFFYAKCSVCGINYMSNLNRR